LLIFAKLSIWKILFDTSSTFFIWNVWRGAARHNESAVFLRSKVACILSAQCSCRSSYFLYLIAYSHITNITIHCVYYESLTLHCSGCVTCRRRFLQADRTESQEVHLPGEPDVHHWQDSEETLSVLPLSEMSRCWHETRRQDLACFVHLIVFPRVSC